MLGISGARMQKPDLLPLLTLACLLREPRTALQAANAQDIQGAQTAGLATPMVDRLRITHQVVVTVAEGCEQIAAMPDLIGRW